MYNLTNSDVILDSTNRGKTKNIEVFKEDLVFNYKTYLWEQNNEIIHTNQQKFTVVYIPSNCLIDNYWHFIVENLHMISYVFNKYNLNDDNVLLMIDLKFQPVYSFASHKIDVQNVSKIFGVELLEKFVGNKKNIIWINSQKKQGINNNINANCLIKGTGGLHEGRWNFNDTKYITNWSFLRNRLMTNYQIDECNIKTYNILFVNRDSAKNKRIINNDEVINGIQKLIKDTNYNLVNVDYAKLTIKKQIEITNNADIVICCCGAGMANSIFLKKNAIFFFCIPDGRRVDHHPSHNKCMPIIPNFFKIHNCSCIINWGNWKDNAYDVKKFIENLSKII